MTSPDVTDGYDLSATLKAVESSLADTPSTSTAPTVRGYQFEDVMDGFLENQSHQYLSIPSQCIPSPHLESSARPLRGVPIPRRARMGGPSRYHYTPTRHHRIRPSQPYANPDGNSDVMFSVPLPHAGPDTLVNKTRRLQHSAQHHIQACRQYGSRDLFKLNPSLAYDARLYSPPPPEPAHDKGKDTTSFSSAFVDGHHGTPESRYWSGWEPITTPYMERTSGSLHSIGFPPLVSPGGQAGVVTSPLSLCSPDTMADKTGLLQTSQPGHYPAHHLCGQALPMITPTPGEGNIMESWSFFNDRYNSPLQQPATYEGSTPFSTATVTTRTPMDPFSRQYPDRALSPFTTAVHQNDMTVSASSTPSTWGSVYSADWIDLDPRHDDTRIPHVTTQSRVSDQLLPISTPPEPGEAPPATLYPTGEDSTVSFPALAKKKRGNCSANCPTALSAQGRLEHVLGPSPALTNKALLRLLLLIVESSFIWTHEMEPIITSAEGQLLLTQIQSIPDCPPNVFQMSECSIFTLFIVARLKFRCLICGSSKQSMVRGVGCVRSHLNHRPYPCYNESGCGTCPEDRIVKRFFTASLLRDHCNIQDRETECTSCGVILTSSMKRHWRAKHSETRFPYDDYPNYRKE